MSLSKIHLQLPGMEAWKFPVFNSSASKNERSWWIPVKWWKWWKVYKPLVNTLRSPATSPGPHLNVPFEANNPFNMKLMKPDCYRWKNPIHFEKPATTFIIGKQIRFTIWFTIAMQLAWLISSNNNYHSLSHQRFKIVNNLHKQPRPIVLIHKQRVSTIEPKWWDSDFWRKQ